MKEEIQVHGLVLASQPVREYDKRLTILTNELGKLTVWASGAKKPGSALMAGCRNFVFAVFTLRPGRSGYNLQSVKVQEYFENIALDLKNACFGSYLLEFANYVIQEEMAVGEMVNLLYLSLKAILNPNLPDELVRRIYELRVLMLNGEYTETPPMRNSSEACGYAWHYVLSTELSRLYTFTLTEEVLREFGANVDCLLADVLPYRFKSLEVLKALAC